MSTGQTDSTYMVKLGQVTAWLWQHKDLCWVSHLASQHSDLAQMQRFVLLDSFQHSSKVEGCVVRETSMHK